MALGFDFGTVYVRGSTFAAVRAGLTELMAEGDREPVQEPGLDPTPDDQPEFKPVRSFALLPDDNGWLAVLEDGHPKDDGGVAEGLSDLLATETLHMSYSDVDGAWSFTRYVDGQPIDSGGADDDDYDVSALTFVETTGVPHFGVYYEEVADGAPAGAPVVAGAGLVGEIHPRIPMGTEILTFARRPWKET